MLKFILSAILITFFSGLSGQNVKPPEKKKPVPATVTPGNGKAKSKDGPVTANDFYRRGVVKNGVNDLQGAIDDFDKSLQEDPEFFLSYLERGKVRFIQQDFQPAMQDFDKTIDIAEKRIDAANKKVNVKIILGDHKGAAKDSYYAESLQPILAEAIFNRGNVKFFLNDSEGCCLDLQKAAALGYLKAYEYLKKYCQAVQVKDTVK